MRASVEYTTSLRHVKGVSGTMHIEISFVPADYIIHDFTYAVKYIL